MSVDQELVESFLVESTDLLEGLGETLIEIEEKEYQDIEDLISKGFRQIHTVKASAGFLGFKIIESLSHGLENLMGQVRSRTLTLDRSCMDLLLEGTRELENAVAMGMESNDLDLSDLLGRLKHAIEGGDGSHPPEDQSAAGSLWYWPFDNPLNSYAIGDEMAKLVRTPAATSSENLAKVRDEMKGVGTIQAESLEDDGSLWLLVETVLDLDMICISVPGLELEAIQPSLELKPKPETPPSPPPPPAPEPMVETPKPEATSDKKSAQAKVHADATLRVKVNLLESLMGLSSELVLSRNQVMDKLGKDDQGHFNVLASQITDLQDAVMKLRLQPLQVVFSKLPRMVRELAGQLNKEVSLDIRGKDVEVDRTMVESLSDPLIHIIRNSLDHGMETPDERVQAGKFKTGTVRIDAYSQGGNVHIDIVDDGRGIDPERVGAKALENGVLSEAELDKMTIEERQALIFCPGFSTAESVSSVSGRGVGMDVVRSKIEELGGKVLLFSELGKGTTLRLMLPLTLAVVPALIVESQGGKVAIPRVNISEMVLVDGAEGARVEKIGDRTVFRLRQDLLSVTRLDSALGSTRTFFDAGDGESQEDRREPGERRLGEPRGDRRQDRHCFEYLIVMKAGSSRYGLLVDRLHPPEEIVVKPLPGYCLGCAHFSGVSILGNGMVVPIINPLELAHRANITLSERQPKSETPKEEAGSATHYWLIAKSKGLQYALPQQLVMRIDEVVSDKLQWQDDQYYLLREEDSMPLILMSDVDDSWEEPDKVEGGFLVVPKYLPIEVGLHFDDIIGIMESTAEIDRVQKCDSFMGKIVIDGVLTKIVDIYGLSGKVMPELKRITLVEETTDEERSDLNLLVAEDSPIFRSIMSKSLIELGFEADFVENGVEALQAIEQKPYDLLLSDIEMPEMDGLQLMDEICAKGLQDKIHCVALTGNQDEKIREAALNRGYHHFMVKFDKKKLGVWLNEFILRKEGALV